MGDGGHDDTLVLYGKFLDKQFLFTGNLEEKEERRTLKHCPDLKVNVLKASQHGNKKSSSPAFLEKTQTRAYSYLSWKEQSNETPPSGNIDTTGRVSIAKFIELTSKRLYVKGWIVGKSKVFDRKDKCCRLVK